MNTKERRRIVNIERLRMLRPIDDDFIRVMLKDNIPLAQMILRIITGMDDLIVTELETQADLRRVTGARSVCLDALCTDSQNRKLDIEIQRADRGAGAHRARYHSSVMDVENLAAGQNFEELPDTYTIFITEKDYFKAGKPVYRIERINTTIGMPFDDGEHILYVNGEYRDESAIGWLMHDFSCAAADEMHFDLMAQRTRYLKEHPEGVREMCRIVEEMVEEGREEGREEGIQTASLEIAKGMLREGIASPEAIAKLCRLPLAQVLELAEGLHA